MAGRASAPRVPVQEELKANNQAIKALVTSLSKQQQQPPGGGANGQYKAPWAAGEGGARANGGGGGWASSE